MVHFWKNLNNRGRILLLLLSSLVLLNIIVVVTTYNLKNLSNSFTSILNDRLVPSSELAIIQGYCYQNRLFLEDDMLINSSHKLIRNKIAANNRLIDSMLVEYKKSFFTEEEGKHLNSFLSVLQKYRVYEEEIQTKLAHNDAGMARKLFYENSQETFSMMIRELQELSTIQVLVGKALYENTGYTIFIIKAVAYCSLCISLLVAAQLLQVLGIKPSN